MRLDNAVKVIKAEPDSQYRLRNCKCGSDNVAYVLGVDGNWRGHCFDCGHTGEGAAVRHDAQVKWNGVLMAKAEKKEKPAPKKCICGRGGSS